MYEFKFLLLIVFCLGAINCFAQSDKKDDDEGSQLPNGFRLGYQYSNLEKNSSDAADNLDRFYVGYCRKVKLAHFFALETGLEYMIAGAQESEDTRLQLHYLVLPAQFTAKIGPFIGLAGLNGNFKIAESLKYQGTTVDQNNDNKSSFFDLAADAGVGFNILMLTIEARYYWGLLDVNDGWHNRYWQAGLKFHF